MQHGAKGLGSSWQSCKHYGQRRGPRATESYSPPAGRKRGSDRHLAESVKLRVGCLLANPTMERGCAGTNSSDSPRHIMMSIDEGQSTPGAAGVERWRCKVPVQQGEAEKRGSRTRLPTRMHGLRLQLWLGSNKNVMVRGMGRHATVGCARPARQDGQAKQDTRKPTMRVMITRCGGSLVTIQRQTTSMARKRDALSTAPATAILVTCTSTHTLKVEGVGGARVGEEMMMGAGMRMGHDLFLWYSL